MANLCYNKDMKDVVTDFLVVQPSVSSGVASLIDLFGTDRYNMSESEEEADSKAIFSDWAMVGKDIQGSVDVAGK